MIKAKGENYRYRIRAISGFYEFADDSVCWYQNYLDICHNEFIRIVRSWTKCVFKADSLILLSFTLSFY
jgi:hypothetical protein